MEQWLSGSESSEPPPKPTKQLKTCAPKPKRPIAKPKVHKQVVDKQRPSQFDEMSEDYSTNNEDLKDIGLDIPFGKEW